MAFTSKRSFPNLRDVLNNVRHSETLYNIPERLEAIFHLYDDLDLSERAREDIYQLLNSACALAEALADPTFPADRASTEVSFILQVLARVNTHLAARPSLSGFVIMHQDTSIILSQFFHSEAEAHLQRERMLTMGVSPKCQVVQAKLISQNVVQPVHRRLPPPPLPPISAVTAFPTPAASEVLVEHPEPTDDTLTAANVAAIVAATAPTTPTVPSETKPQ